jgi:hypothetical protein
MSFAGLNLICQIDWGTPVEGSHLASYGKNSYARLLGVKLIIAAI